MPDQSSQRPTGGAPASGSAAGGSAVPAGGSAVPASGSAAGGSAPGALTPERFRRATSRYATGIAVVTTLADDIDHAMTANSFTSVSLDPLLALVCVERDSRFHSAVLAAGVWSVSFLPEGQEAVARWFATRGRPLVGQFDQVPTLRGSNGCLLLADGLAALELRTQQVVPAGDHDVLISAVTQVHEVTEDGRPLVYFGSTFRGLA